VPVSRSDLFAVERYLQIISTMARRVIPDNHGRKGLTNILVVGGIDKEKKRAIRPLQDRKTIQVRRVLARRVALHERVSAWKTT
jgi:hypothetical protein